MQADVVCGTNSVAQGFQVCHCEAPKGPWQSRSTRPDNKMAPAKTQLPARDSHVASLLGMTNLGALRGRRSHSITCQPARRSLGAATDAIGWYVFIGTLYELEVPSRDCHVGLRPPRNDTGGRHSQVCPCAPPGEAGYQICHCEAPQEPWQSRSTGRNTGKPPANSQLPSRDCRVGLAPSSQ